jgi:(2Fe-2S) ferredoxin
VFYPEWVCYGGATEAGIERILQEHVLGGKVVEELVIGRGELKD